MEIFTISLIFATAFIPRFLAAYKIDMTWDEGLYVLGGVTALKNIATFNFSSSAWGFEFHPPVAMYIYGVAYSIYVLTKAILKHGFNFDFNFLYGEGLRLFTGRGALLVIRLPSIILGSLSCVLTYLLCLDLFKNEMIGIAAALFLALTPVFIAWSSLAMLESGITFFYLLTIWTIFRAVEYGSIGYAVLSGISLGLAFGSKETGFSIPLVVLPWLAFSSLKTYTIEGLNAVIGKYWFLALWLLLGVAVFYVVWPWLWRNPIKQLTKNLRDVSKMTSSGGYGFYIISLLAATPVSLSFLYGIGMLEAVYMASQQISLLLILSWIFLPLIIMSMPFIPKRGEYELIFIQPAFSILAGLSTYLFSEVTAEFFNIPLSLAMVILGLMFMCPVVFACINAHPYYTNYHNFIVGLIDKAKRKFFWGWWGEGMGDAIAYIDKHAPPNTTVWIYGPKSTALYHSNRVDLKNSLMNDLLFYERSKSGVNVPVDEPFYLWREGDLTFYFPYYHPNEHLDLNVEQLKGKNVSYVVISRWATYNPNITGIDSNNHKFIRALREHHLPVHLVKIKGLETCWVYKVESV